MRDLVLAAIVFGTLPLIFRRPELGALLWAWLSLMNPQKLTYGWAFNLPFAQATALVTLLALLAAKMRRSIPWTPVTVLWVMLHVWMTVTSFFAINGSDLVLERWIFVAKIQLMLAVSLALLTEPRHLKWLVWVVTLSVTFYGIKGGVYTVLTGGSGRVWGPPGGMLQGNNELAVGLVMLVPFLYWMRETVRQIWARRALLLSMVLCVFSILGSQSRGALLAIVTMSLPLALKSKNKIGAALLLGVGLVVAVAFMPQSWVSRMETIQTYEEDASALSRVWTWTTLWNAAVDRPLVGAGFRADSREVFRRYAPTGDKWDQFAGQIFVAHSIYFQMLGEHGFVGLFLFIGLWLAVWVTAGRLARQSLSVPEFASWMPVLMRMTQTSLVGFSVGGAFLSLAYLDLTYYLMGFVILAGSFLHEASTRSAGSANRPPAARVPARPATNVNLPGRRP